MGCDESKSTQACFAALWASDKKCRKECAPFYYDQWREVRVGENMGYTTWKRTDKVQSHGQFDLDLTWLPTVLKKKICLNGHICSPHPNPGGALSSPKRDLKKSTIFWMKQSWGTFLAFWMTVVWGEVLQILVSNSGIVKVSTEYAVCRVLVCMDSLAL